MVYATRSEWQTQCDSDASATFFQTPAWLELAARHSNSEAVAWLFEANGYCCILPLLKQRNWAFDFFRSPFGTYSGPISSAFSGVTFPTELRSCLLDFFGQHNIEYCSSPYTKTFIPVTANLENTTWILDCEELDSECVEKNWKKGQKKLLRRGHREGLTVRLAETAADWKMYDLIYRKQLRRWGESARRAYTSEFFEDLRATIPKNQVRLWLVFENATMVAGCLCFEYHQRIHGWHTATLASAFCQGVNLVMHHAVLKDAVQRGMQIYDLNPSGGLAGVEAFKASLGARRLVFQGGWQWTPLYRQLKRLKSWVSPV